jgi:Carboxypeptidase regulatory-like domain
MKSIPNTTLKLTARFLMAICLVGVLPAMVAFAQNQAAQVSGLITDPTGAVIPNATVEVLNKDTGIIHRTESNGEGYYVVPLLQPGAYKLTATAKGFENLVHDGVVLSISENAKIDFAFRPGAQTQSVTVTSDAAQINQESAELQTGIPPSTLANLPLIVAGGPRNMSGLVTLIPGVSSPTNTPTSAHMNGGLAFEQETILDGVGIAYATGGSGMFNLSTDFPQSPDMIREISVLTGNYAPEYGNSAAASIILETKSGTDQFHGVVFDYLRNTVLNAANYGAAGKRSPDLENEFGGSIGGPMKIPMLQTAKSKPFFFVIWEGYRSAGNPTRPVVSIPSVQERAGDFRDWTDSNGALIPIYDPATTTIVAGKVIRQQFMGCDGATPNVICPTDPRIQNSLAQKWFQFLPKPTSSGPINNYAPTHPPSNIYGNRDTIDSRVDEYYGEKDHFSGSYYRMSYVGIPPTLLPPQLGQESEVACNGACVNTMVRLNEDHIFGPTLLNHFACGLTRAGNGKETFPSQKYASDFPQIPGVPNPQYTSQINFTNGFKGYGGSNGSTGWSIFNIWNDTAEWSLGTHIFKFGGEYRRIAVNESGGGTPGGAFSFASGETGISGSASGSPIASFLLGEVDSTSATVYGEGGIYNPRQYVAVLHAGDTWKASPKLSLSYGVRWDLHPPSEEKHNKMSFFDPTGLNTEAGNLPGRLAFAGKQWGAASYGARYPETVVLTDFAPRLGFAYSPNAKTVVRGGYGIFYSDAKYPGWGMGVSTNGFDANPSFSSTLGGLQAATLLSQGFPQNFKKPPFIDSGYLNGQSGPLYRPISSNHTPYSQQWDLVVERQVTSNLYASAGYTGNKGTHLYSYVASPNTLNPALLSLGATLNDSFGPADTSKDGAAAPYAGWANQSSCGSTVAQALLPYPQYCGDIHAVNENKGISEYHSLQLKVEKRASANGYVLASYTFAKLLTNVDSTQPGAEYGGLFSPYQRWRNYGLATSDVKQTFTTAYVYHLPFGRGKRWLNNGSISNGVLGGWETSGVLHINGAPPFAFRSSACSVPSQFDAQCVPAILPGANPFAQSPHSFNPKLPLFNPAAFEPVSSFNGFYLGQGARVTNVRAFPYHNEDLALYKNTAITERLKFELRAEFFNIWNWHTFQSGSNFGTSTTVFSTDIGSSGFGAWNGGVTPPRNIQLAGRFTF